MILHIKKKPVQYRRGKYFIIEGNTMLMFDTEYPGHLVSQPTLFGKSSVKVEVP